jgi:acylphosphatase
MSDTGTVQGSTAQAARVAHRVIVRGRVQGVGFRYAMCASARAAAVCGWVRNRHDGCVEAHVQGAHADVLRVIEWARRGPPGARVDAIEVHEATPDLALTGFEQRPTA